MSIRKKPKFKIGDIVKVLPWENFEYHLEIRKISWLEAEAGKYTIKYVNTSEHHKENGVIIYGVYYTINDDGFWWYEKFLDFYKKPEFLTDGDFEI